MATIDPARGVLVVRIVYDGPALSGKTTSVRALAAGLGSTVACPEERAGRTLYFDWADYVGGLFEGRQIHCQIVSVPGQRELSARRSHLLAEADAVVCVLDTRRTEVEHGVAWLRELGAQCRASRPPVGIVVQANKRDARDALPRPELRALVDSVGPLALVESVATGNDGIREAFVLSVRLALDRVRALAAEQALAVAAPQVDGPEALLRAMERDARAPTQASPAAREAEPLPALSCTLDTRVLPADEPALVPDPHMPGGMIWPPVDGRAILHEVARLAIRPERTARGEFWASASGFRFHSRPDALYVDADQARLALLAWARIHAACAEQITAGRVVMLAPAGGGRLRLWQIVRVEQPLREQLAHVLAHGSADELAQGVIEIAARLCAARDWFEHAAARLPCTLWTVTAASGYRPAFAGLMPDDRLVLAPEPRGRELVARELGRHLADLRRARVDGLEVRCRIAERAATSQAADWLAQVGD